ncbi:MAG: hypothetical protein LC792_18180, partial [Actinobacteria bacterium]|nr:hypothetical protein [Actinomycetota bacterium]
EVIEAEVRRWAATNRQRDVAAPTVASLPLHALAPLTPGPAVSSNRWLGRIRRLLQRLLAGQIVPIVDQVNNLRRATIASIDTPSAGDPSDPDG